MMKRLYMILAMLAVVATINATKIYHGNSTYVGNITYTTDGPIPPVIMSLLL